MQTLDKRTATIITAVLGVLFGCSGILACVGSVLTLTSIGRFEGSFSAGGWVNLIQGVCMAAAFIALPAVFYMLLLRGRSDSGDAAPMAAVPSMMESSTPAKADSKPAPSVDKATAEEQRVSSPPSPSMMADATFIEQPDDPSMKATIVGSGMGPDDDDGDDE